MFAVVTGKLTVPTEPAVKAPFCAPTDTALGAALAMSRTNAPDWVPSKVRVNVERVPAATEAVTAKVNVPLLSAIVTSPETVAPMGRFATVAAVGAIENIHGRYGEICRSRRACG